MYLTINQKLAVGQHARKKITNAY